MKKKFLADECTFGLTVHLLRNLGYDVVRIQEPGMAGSPDEAVYAKANELRATLITNDHGFADIRQYPPSSSKGIIVLKILPDPESVQAVHNVLNRLLINERQFHGNLYIVDRGKYRKRSKP